MKKVVLLFFVLFTLTIYNVNAQEKKKSFDLEAFRKERADFLIKEMGLTDDEAKAFVPLCNELMAKKFALNKEVRKQGRMLSQKGNNATSADYESLSQLMIENKLKEAQLDKEYYQKFKTILSSEKIYKFQLAETKFMKRTVRTSDVKRDHSHGK